MSTLARAMMSGPGAFVVTTGLALVMAKMIYVPFVALQDEPEKMSFIVNPEIIEESTIKDNRPQKLERIVPPPAPPIIERETPNLPTVPIANMDDAIPDFDKPVLDPQTFTLVIADKEEQPILRFDPVMPPRAEKSGHCKVRFNLTAQGQPFEIMATYCTQSIFKRPTIKAVQKWKYNPKIKNGVAVTRHGVETLITFNLVDERGHLIPE